MTIEELRKHKDYADAMEKIRNYREGFKFTIDYTEIPTAKANALRILLHDACKNGLLKNVATGVSLDCEITDETFIRL